MLLIFILRRSVMVRRRFKMVWITIRAEVRQLNYTDDMRV